MRKKPKLVLLTLHGMGEVEEGYHLPVQTGLAKRLGAQWADVSLQAVQYADIFQTPEDQLWHDIEAAPQNVLRWKESRQFFLFRFADATAFERSYHVAPATYEAVQQRIIDKLQAGFDACGRDPETKLVVLAYSLGCQVFSSYVWDVMHGKRESENDFCALEHWPLFLTMGCNIPVFTAGLKRRKNFPMRPGFEWHNYYDPDDVLGWPLAQLDDQGSYAAVQDHPVEVGSLFTGWNPACHTGYWSNDALQDEFAERLRQALK